MIEILTIQDKHSEERIIEKLICAHNVIDFEIEPKEKNICMWEEACGVTDLEIEPVQVTPKIALHKATKSKMDFLEIETPRSSVPNIQQSLANELETPKSSVNGLASEGT